MTNLAYLAAFFGASACWGVIGFVLGIRHGIVLERRRIVRQFFTVADVPNASDLIGVSCELVYHPSNVADPDAALDAEIEGSK